MNNASVPRSRGPRNDRRNWAGVPSRGRNGDPRMMDVMKMIGAFTNCLESFTRRKKEKRPKIKCMIIQKAKSYPINVKYQKSFSQ